MLHKKQMYNLLVDIASINNKQWNNPRFSFDADLSASMRIEESLESIGAVNPKETARQIVATIPRDPTVDVLEVDLFDSLLDDLYIVIGDLHKMGVTPELIVDGLQTVHNANSQKLAVKDSEGKIIKPTNFVPPEEKLQELLDRRPR